MNLKIPALIVVGVLIFTPSVSGIAAIKSGATCKKLGAIRIESKKTYICTKEKKKLIWRLRNTIEPKPTASPMPSSSSSPLPTQTNVPTPSASPSVDLTVLERVSLSNAIFYRLNEGRLERKSDLGLFFERDSRIQAEFSPIRNKAFNEIIGQPRANGHSNVNFVWDKRPSFPTAIFNYQLKRANEAAEIFNSLFASPITIKALAATEKDAEYPPAKNQYFSDTYEQLKRIGQLNKENQLIWITGGGGYWDIQGETLGRLFLGTPSDADPKYYSPEWIQLASHEFFHIVQQYLLFPRVNEGQVDFNLKVPHHFREGSANFIGYALSAENLGWYSDAMDVSLIRYWKGSGQGINTRTEADMISLLRFTESRNDPKAFELGYPVGAIFWEWVVGTYGYDKFTALMRELGKSTSFNESTTKILGLGKEELYKNAAPYLLSVFNRAINN